MLYCTFSHAWWSWQAILNYSHISKYYVDSNILASLEAGCGNCFIYWHLHHFHVSQEDKYRNKKVLEKLNNFCIFFFQKAKLLANKKAEGNDAFKHNHTQKAFDLYSEALEIDPNNRKTNAKLFCNRALVGSKVCIVMYM